jgi:CBS domain-containing protein
MDTELSVILKRKGSVVHSVGPQATIAEAVALMNQEHIGALLVLEHGAIVGILTERDVLVRIVGRDRSPRETHVGDVMTREVFVAGPRDKVGSTMGVMTRRKCRHLPVVQGGRTIGLISTGDLVRAVAWEAEHDVHELEHYITGTY